MSASIIIINNQLENNKKIKTPKSSTNSTQLNAGKILESGLEKELLKFFNNAIMKDTTGIISVGDINSIRKKYETQVRNIIRKYVSKGFNESNKYIEKFIKESNLENKFNNGQEIPLFQSQGDTQNIENITNSIINIFFTRVNKLIQRNIVHNEVIINQSATTAEESQKVKNDFDVAANMALTANAIFSIINSSIPNKIRDIFSNISSNDTNATTFEQLKQEFEIIFLSRNDGLVDLGSKIKPCLNNHGNTWEIDDIVSMVIPPDDLHPHCRCILAVRSKKTGRIFI